jgi:broad specificity phosphatase PhoE
LLACAPTAGFRRAVFGGDEDLDAGGRAAARTLADGPDPLGRVDAWLAAPSTAARETARAAGHEPLAEPDLADCAYGAWTGRPLHEVAAAEPHAVHAWLTDPDAAPHGGESLTALIARVGAWLDGPAARPRAVVAVTHAAVVRAALVHALALPAAGFWQVDVAPLSVTRLRRRGDRWTLHLPALRAHNSFERHVDSAGSRSSSS